MYVSGSLPTLLSSTFPLSSVSVYSIETIEASCTADAAFNVIAWPDWPPPLTLARLVRKNKTPRTAPLITNKLKSFFIINASASSPVDQSQCESLVGCGDRREPHRFCHSPASRLGPAVSPQSAA